MDLGSSPISSIGRALSRYSELLNYIRVSSGKPRLEPGKLLRYATKTSSIPVLLVSLVLYATSKTFHSDFLLYFTIPATVLVFLLAPLASELLSYVSYVKNLKEELAYFVIIEGVSPGDDLVKDLEEESEHACSFLPRLSNEYSRLKLFTKFFPGVKGIKEYVVRAPKPTRKLLLEYLVARESADFGTWIYSKFQETLRELKTSAKNSLELKTILSITTTIFNGLAPPLMALVAVLSGREVLYIYPIMAIPGLALAVSEGLTPRLLKISSECGKIRKAVAAAALSVFLAPLVGTRNSILVAGILLLLFGAIATARFITAYAGIISLPSKLLSLADKVPYSHNPVELVEESLVKPRSYSVFASLCYYMLLRSVRLGSINTARIIAFKDIVEELFSLVKQSIIVRALVIATALFLPHILNSSASLVAAAGLASSEMSVYYFTSSLFYSIVATLVAFGTLENTLLVGIVLLELYAMGATP